MYWVILLIAGLLEAGWVIGIQKSVSFSKFSYVVLAVSSMAISLVLFTVSLKKIPINQAYLIWIATGVVTISIINHYYFNQLLSTSHLFCICLIFIGVAGLKLL